MSKDQKAADKIKAALDRNDIPGGVKAMQDAFKADPQLQDDFVKHLQGR